MSVVRVSFAVVSCNKFVLYRRSIVCRHTLSQFVRHVVTMSQGNYCDCILLRGCVTPVFALLTYDGVK